MIKDQNPTMLFIPVQNMNTVSVNKLTNSIIRKNILVMISYFQQTKRYVLQYLIEQISQWFP